jgi:hypothetical protein
MPIIGGSAKGKKGLLKQVGGSFSSTAPVKSLESDGLSLNGLAPFAQVSTVDLDVDFALTFRRLCVGLVLTVR